MLRGGIIYTKTPICTQLTKHLYAPSISPPASFQALSLAIRLKNPLPHREFTEKLSLPFIQYLYNYNFLYNH